MSSKMTYASSKNSLENNKRKKSVQLLIEDNGQILKNEI